MIKNPKMEKCGIEEKEKDRCISNFDNWKLPKVKEIIEKYKSIEDLPLYIDPIATWLGGTPVIPEMFGLRLKGNRDCTNFWCFFRKEMEK
jgi:hypothetical protein